MSRNLIRIAAIGTILVAGAVTLVSSCGDMLEDKESAAKADSVLEISLSWDASTETGIDSFHVYGIAASGAGEAAAALPEDWKLLDEQAATEAGFDPKAPKVLLTTKKHVQLKALRGGGACFRVKAASAAGESVASNIVCDQM